MMYFDAVKLVPNPPYFLRWRIIKRGMNRPNRGNQAAFKFVYIPEICYFYPNFYPTIRNLEMKTQ